MRTQQCCFPLQGAASSVAADNKGAEMLLAYNEELPPEDCTEGADESDDGGARRMLRSHAAAAAAAAGTAGNGAGFKRAALQVSSSAKLMHCLARPSATCQTFTRLVPSPSCCITTYILEHQRYERLDMVWEFCLVCKVYFV